MKYSLVYSNVHAYRIVMNLLYTGRYRRRFANIVKAFGPEVHSVCDLCFGDTYIAEWCRAREIQWTGVDLNPSFCRRAQKLGLNVLQGDLFSVDLPTADVFVMAGSLYHFYDKLDSVFDTVLGRTRRFILSEPVRNLSSRGGIVGWYAGRSANPGTGEVAFRFNEENLLKSIECQRKRLRFSYQVVSVDRDILLDIVR